MPFIIVRNPESEPLLTARQVASRFNVAPKTVTRWCRAGMFPHAHQSGNQSSWLIPEGDLEGFEPPHAPGLASVAAPGRGVPALTASEVAARFGVHRETVRSWCEAGRFPNAYKESNRRKRPRWMVPEGDLEGFDPPALRRLSRQLRRGNLTDALVATVALLSRRTGRLERLNALASEAPPSNLDEILDRLPA